MIQRKKYGKKRNFGICILLYIGIITTDFTLSKMNLRPIFAICTTIYKDGGTSIYYGLGYKIIKYKRFEGDGRNETVFGSWALSYTK